MRTRVLAALFALASLAPLEAQTVNGCTFAAATNLLGATSTTVSFTSFSYNPPCIRVQPGFQVTFAGGFSSHPLRPGEVVGGVPVPDPTSPIAATSSGTTATFQLDDPGTFPYYCDFHGPPFSMFGAIFVAVFADGFESANFCAWSTVSGGKQCV